jgi:carboxyl-terminal processing protease
MMKNHSIRKKNRWAGLTLAIAIVSCWFSLWIVPGIAKNTSEVQVAKPGWEQAATLANVKPAEIFDEVWQTVNDNFYDPNFSGVDWPSMRRKYQPQAQQAQTSAAVSEVINQMLAELKASHTRFYTQAEPAYYQLLGIFDGDSTLLEKRKAVLPGGSIDYPGIGLFTRTLEGKTFVSGILDGSPAATGSLKVGDQLLAADGQPYQPVQSFVGKVGQSVRLTIQRSPSGAGQEASTQTISVTPKIYKPQTMFIDAMKNSVQVIEQEGKKIGYIHVWCYAGDRYQDLLIQELNTRLKSADSLVLDLREGWGGASPDYLSLFTAKVPQTIMVRRDGKKYSYDSQWRKPVVMLVNQGARSGKEILAFGFQRYGIGQVVGSQTAGAVLGGRPFLMKDGSMLYLAVTDVFTDGERLEGKGVTPNISVPFQLEYAQGADPQKEQAITAAVSAIAETVNQRS